MTTTHADDAAAAACTAGDPIPTANWATAHSSPPPPPRRSRSAPPPTGVLASGNDRHTCGIQARHALYCWGYNADGELGLGDTALRTVPTRVGTNSWSDLSAGYVATCGIQTDSSLWCWGANGHGELGSGPGGSVSSPKRVGTATDWLEVRSNNYTVCARRVNGSLWCWGNNLDGQLGQGDYTQRNTPIQVGTATDWNALAVGAFHECGIRAGGQLWCVGSDYGGQLGLGDGRVNSDVPTMSRVGAAQDWFTVAAGVNHTCGVRAGAGTRHGTLWCWGANGDGQLGLGDMAQRNAPIQVGTDTDWASVAAGDHFTCATTTTGSAWCWGANAVGETGTGGTGTVLVPTQIVGGGTAHRVYPGGTSLFFVS